MDTCLLVQHPHLSLGPRPIAMEQSEGVGSDRTGKTAIFLCFSEYGASLSEGKKNNNNNNRRPNLIIMNDT